MTDAHIRDRCKSHLAAKPRVRKEPGYFNANGKFIHGPIYRLIMDGPVSIDTAPGFIPEAGAYFSRSQAKQAAEHIRAWCRDHGVVTTGLTTDVTDDS